MNNDKKEKSIKDKSKDMLNEISVYRKEKKSKSNKIQIKQKKSINLKNKRKNIPKIIQKKINNKEIINKFNYIDEEINEFSYYLAIQYDKRNYCQYYTSLIKTKHSLIFAFFNNNDYNSQIFKIDLFFIGFTIDYTVNALFFNDDTMHKIYQNKGKFDFESQILIIIYSTLISMVLNTPLNFLSLSNDSIINFKQNNNKTFTLIRKLILKK